MDALNKECAFLLTTEFATTITFSNVRCYYDLEVNNFVQDYDRVKEDIDSLKENADFWGKEIEALKEGVIARPYYGKKILFMGDSITELNVLDRGWCKYFNEIIQPSLFVNTAVAGA